MFENKVSVNQITVINVINVVNQITVINVIWEMMYELFFYLVFT